MDAEITALEEKIRLATTLCHRLLSEKIDGARSRLEGLLQRIPE
jgi:hypothetical protein